MDSEIIHVIHLNVDRTITSYPLNVFSFSIWDSRVDLVSESISQTFRLSSVLATVLTLISCVRSVLVMEKCRRNIVSTCALVMYKNVDDTGH